MVTLIPDVTVYSECPAFLDVEDPHKLPLGCSVNPKNLMQSKPMQSPCLIVWRSNSCPPYLGSKLTSIPWLQGWFIFGHQYLKCPEMIPRFPLETCETTIKINTKPTLDIMSTLFHHSTPILKPCWFSMIFPWIHKHNSDLSVCFTLFPWFSLSLQPLFPPSAPLDPPRTPRARRPTWWCRTRSRSRASCRTGNRRSSKWPKLDGNIVGGGLGGDRVPQ